MTFLDIVNKMNILSGIQSTISDTAATVGIQSVIVQCAQDAWIQIQNYRKDWTFMVGTTSFLTVQGQEVYTPAEVFVSSNPDLLGIYIEKMIIYDYRALRYVTPAEYPFIENLTEGKPSYFTIEPSNNYIYMNLPDGEYTIEPYYIKTPQILVSSTDTPNVSVRYHDLVVYKGLELLATYIGNPELFQKYSSETSVLMGAMMREYIPSRVAYLNGGIA